MRLSKVFAAVAIVAASSASFAQSVDLYAFGSTGVVLSKVSLNGGDYYDMGAVEYHVSQSSTGNPSFAAFCLEPTVHFFNVNPTTFTKGSPAAAAEFSKLFTGAGWDANNWQNDGVTTNAQAAAIALAVWDIAIDGKLDFSTGNFRAQADAQTSFAEAAYAKGNGSMTDYILSLQNDQFQDLVSAVPEPSTYAMLLAGLAGIGFVARRRRG